MGVDGPAMAGLGCDVVRLTGVGATATCVVGLTGVGATETCIRFAALSSSATSTIDRFATLFCFGFGMELNRRVLISAKSSSP